MNKRDMGDSGPGRDRCRPPLRKTSVATERARVYAKRRGCGLFCRIVIGAAALGECVSAGRGARGALAEGELRQAGF